MSQEILAVAIFEVLPGKEETVVSIIHELSAILAAGGYSRDVFYRDTAPSHEFVMLRYWKSEEARRGAQENPDVQRCWARLGPDIRIVKVYEHLEEANA